MQTCAHLLKVELQKYLLGENKIEITQIFKTSLTYVTISTECRETINNFYLQILKIEVLTDRYVHTVPDTASYIRG